MANKTLDLAHTLVASFRFLLNRSSILFRYFAYKISEKVLRIDNINSHPQSIFIHFGRKRNWLRGLHPNLAFYKNRQRGITLIEIMVVIGMFTVIASFSMLMTIDSYRSVLSKNDIEIITSMLSRARSQAINNICLGASCIEGEPHGFHIESSSYTIFQGGAYDPTDPLNEVKEVAGGLTSISGLSNIVFSQLSGDANPAGAIVVTTQSGRSYSIEVNNEGRITVVNL